MKTLKLWHNLRNMQGNLNIEHRTAIVGPNGSGKSTHMAAIRIAAGNVLKDDPANYQGLGQISASFEDEDIMSLADVSVADILYASEAKRREAIVTYYRPNLDMSDLSQRELELYAGLDNPYEGLERLRKLIPQQTKEINAKQKSIDAISLEDIAAPGTVDELKKKFELATKYEMFLKQEARADRLDEEIGALSSTSAASDEALLSSIDLAIKLIQARPGDKCPCCKTEGFKYLDRLKELAAAKGNLRVNGTLQALKADRLGIILSPVDYKGPPASEILDTISRMTQREAKRRERDERKQGLAHLEAEARVTKNLYGKLKRAVSSSLQNTEARMMMDLNTYLPAGFSADVKLTETKSAILLKSLGDGAYRTFEALSGAEQAVLTLATALTLSQGCNLLLLDDRDMYGLSHENAFNLLTQLSRVFEGYVVIATSREEDIPEMYKKIKTKIS